MNDDVLGEIMYCVQPVHTWSADRALELPSTPLTRSRRIWNHNLRCMWNVCRRWRRVVDKGLIPKLGWPLIELHRDEGREDEIWVVDR